MIPAYTVHSRIFFERSYTHDYAASFSGYVSASTTELMYTSFSVY